MEEYTATDVLSSKLFEDVLRNSPFADRTERIRNTLLEVHHQFLEQKLVGHQSGPDVDFSLLEETAYYLSGVATTPKRSDDIPIDTRSKMLAVSALIFEYLGDSAESHPENPNLERSHIYYLDACICNSLSLFEANTIALSTKHLKKLGDINEKINNKDILFNQTDSLNLIYSWLARDMQFIWVRRSKLESGLKQTTEYLNRKLAQNELSRHVYQEMTFWIFLVKAIISHARFFQFGKEEYLVSSSEFFNQAIDTSKSLNDPPLVWVAVALQKCSQVMSKNSVWSRLSNICSDRYIRRLVTSNSPVMELWTSQIAALENSLDNNLELASANELIDGYLDPRAKRVVINMPTSAGKTLLAELAIIRTLFPNKSMTRPLSNITCIYVVPTLALANQIESKFSARLLPLGIRATAILGGYDTAFLDESIFSKTRVAIITPEKLDMLTRQDHPFVQQCGLYIFDEVHKLDNIGRGFTMEMLITWLKDFHPKASTSKMIFISAVLPNILEIKSWVNATNGIDGGIPAISIYSNWQPTRQIKGVFEVDRYDLIEKIVTEKPAAVEYWFGGHLTYVASRDDLSNPRQIRRLIRYKNTFRIVTKRKTGKKEEERDSALSFGVEETAAEIAKKYVGANLDPVLVFFMSREETRSFCSYLATEDYSPKNLSRRDQDQFNSFITYIRERLGNNHPLSLFVQKGIAYHHGWLPKDVREEIEYAISRRWVRVVASTTTLIDGVNFPISTFILANYEKVVGTIKSTDDPSKTIPIIRRLEKKDFQNMIGRAGRAVFDTEGQIIFMAPLNPLSRDVTWQDYMFVTQNDPERMVLSSLNRQDFNFHVLQEMLVSLESSILPIDSLFVDPDALDKKYGSGARDVGETILRLQAFLLAMMDRDILMPNKLETFVTFLNKTLFGQQKHTEILFDIVAKFTQTTGESILLAEPNKQKRSTYSKIGMGFTSCHSLYERSQNYWDSYAKLNFHRDIPHIEEEFLQEIGNFILSLPEVKPDPVRIPHRKPAPIINLVHGQLLTDWVINSLSVSDIREKYFNDIPDISESTEACVNYIRDAFEYKAPWALSAFYMFVSKISQNEAFINSPLATQLSMLPAYAKFGVNNPAAALFSMIGVNARDVSILLAKHYNEENPSHYIDFSRMLDWLLRLEPEQVAGWFASLHNEDVAGYVPRLFRFLDSIRSQEQTLDGLLPLEFEVAGWQYYRGPKVLSRLSIQDNVLLKPDPLNPWDSYAVEVYDLFGNKLGFIPREYSRAVYLHLISDLPIKSEITRIESTLENKPIQITLDSV